MKIVFYENRFIFVNVMGLYLIIDREMSCSTSVIFEIYAFKLLIKFNIFYLHKMSNECLEFSNCYII